MNFKKYPVPFAVLGVIAIAVVIWAVTHKKQGALGLAAQVITRFDKRSIREREAALEAQNRLMDPDAPEVYKLVSQPDVMRVSNAIFMPDDQALYETTDGYLLDTRKAYFKLLPRFDGAHGYWEPCYNRDRKKFYFIKFGAGSDNTRNINQAMDPNIVEPAGSNDRALKRFLVEYDAATNEEIELCRLEGAAENLCQLASWGDRVYGISASKKNGKIRYVVIKFSLAAKRMEQIELAPVSGVHRQYFKFDPVTHKLFYVQAQVNPKRSSIVARDLDRDQVEIIYGNTPPFKMKKQGSVIGIKDYVISDDGKIISILGLQADGKIAFLEKANDASPQVRLIRLETSWWQGGKLIRRAGDGLWMVGKIRRDQINNSYTRDNQTFLNLYEGILKLEVK